MMGEEKEFLPALLEVQETPPSPTGRFTALSIGLVFLSALVWAFAGQVDIVAVAEGRVIPSGHRKLIQSPYTGVVRRIHVVDGQQVERGDLLVELDHEIAEAEVKRLQQQIDDSETEILRLGVLSGWLQKGTANSDGYPLKTLPPSQQRLLQAQWQAHRARISRLESEQRRHRSGKQSALHQLEKLQAVLPIVTQRARKLEQLYSQKYLSEEQYLEMEQRRLETLHEAAAQQDHAAELQAADDQIAAQVDQVTREFEGRIFDELVVAEKRHFELTQELTKARKRVQQHFLLAPVSGVVQQLVTHTIGGVVTPAQQLMVIVPGNGELEIEALVENKDIGFVAEGKRAEVKFDAFPFTRYGVIDAWVIGISSDAVSDERRGLVYRARVLLARPSISIDGKDFRFTPGMKVAVEIKTGKRRLIEYFLSPLLRYRQESIRER